MPVPRQHDGTNIGMYAWAARSRRNYYVAFTSLYGSVMAAALLFLGWQKGYLTWRSGILVALVCYAGGLAFSWLFWILFAGRYIPKR